MYRWTALWTLSCVLNMASEDIPRKTFTDKVHNCVHHHLTTSFHVRLKLFVDSEVKDYRGSRDIESLMEFVSTSIKGEQVWFSVREH